MYKKFWCNEHRRENEGGYRLRRLGHVEKRNNEDIIVEKLGDIKVEGNRRERARLKEKWIKVIGRGEL